MNSLIAPSYTEQEKERIHAQLERLLANHHFANSRRFPSFLRFVVEEELDGRGDQLKERTLGTAVFGRSPTYDTTSDPIVRVTAAEIRKRIAQYYQEPGHAGELRISLPPGSYLPHFEWPKTTAQGVPEPSISPAGLPAAVSKPASPQPEPAASVKAIQPLSQPSSQPSPLRRRSLLITISALLLVSAAIGSALLLDRPTALDLFWKPVLASGDPVIVCFPQSHLTGITLRQADDPLQQHHLDENMNAVIVDDLSPLVSLSGLIELHHQRYVLEGEESASLTDLRQGPAVFVGAFDNAWTLRLTRGLRFRFANDPEMKHFWIEDTQSPTHTRWGIDRNQQEATNNYRDYAIVARFQDPSTGRLDVIAAGIARGGTVAAGEFLTQDANMETLRSRAPRDWQSKNMELVLSTEIIDGRSAPPKIEAVYFW